MAWAEVRSRTTVHDVPAAVHDLLECCQGGAGLPSQGTNDDTNSS